MRVIYLLSIMYRYAHTILVYKNDVHLLRLKQDVHHDVLDHLFQKECQNMDRM